MNYKSTRLSFDSENLQLDWISFTIQSELESELVQKLLHYLWERLEYSILITKINDYSTVETSHLSLSNPDFKVYLTPLRQTYWNGVVLSFRGFQAQMFYRLIQEAAVNWDFFQEAKLNRIDLCYDRPLGGMIPS